MTTTNPRPERPFTPQTEAERIMYDALYRLANQDNELKYDDAYYIGRWDVLNHVKQAAQATLQALDAPQTAGTGVQRYEVHSMAWGRSGDVFKIFDTQEVIYLYDEYWDSEDADRVCSTLNAQPAADTGDESEGAK